MRITQFFAALCISTTLFGANSGASKKEDEKIEKGLAISPVKVNVTDRNRRLVGLGSYLVNATAGCATCHTCPTYAPGHNTGKDKQINALNYMAGGVSFNSGVEPGPSVSLTSANLTPDARGLPGGLTFLQFQAVFTEGHKTLAQAYSEVPAPSEVYSGEISVMPWRIYQNMETGDFEAIYEYLKSIPPAKPGSCTGPGQ